MQCMLLLQELAPKQNHTRPGRSQIDCEYPSKHRNSWYQERESLMCSVATDGSPWVKGQYPMLGKTQLFRNPSSRACVLRGKAFSSAPLEGNLETPFGNFSCFALPTISAPLRLWSRLIDYFLICALLNSHIRLTITYMASFTLQQCPISSYYEEHHGSCVVTASLTAVCTWTMVHRAGPGPGSRFITKSKGWLLAWHPALESWFSNVLYVRNT